MLTKIPLATWPVLVEQGVGTGWGLMDDDDLALKVPLGWYHFSARPPHFRQKRQPGPGPAPLPAISAGEQAQLRDGISDGSHLWVWRT